MCEIRKKKETQRFLKTCVKFMSNISRSAYVHYDYGSEALEGRKEEKRRGEQFIPAAPSSSFHSDETFQRTLTRLQETKLLRRGRRHQLFWPRPIIIGVRFPLSLFPLLLEMVGCWVKDISEFRILLQLISTANL